VTAVTLVVGIGLALLLERTDLPFRRLLGVVAALPLVVPSYVAALALVSAFGPGALVTEVPGMVGFWGAVLALSVSTYPYVLLVVRARLAGVDRSLEDAARTLGNGSRRIFLRVLLPQLRPAIAGSGLLVLLYVFSDFGAVSVTRVDTLSRGIFSAYRSSFNRAPAALLGVVLVVLTLAAIVAERSIRGRIRPPRVSQGAAAPRRVRLGPWRWPLALGVLGVGGLGVGIPVGVLVHWARIGTSDPAASHVLARAAATSFGLSAAAAIVAVVLAVPVAVLAVRHRSRFSRLVETLAVSGYALPGLVVALALVFLAARQLPWLYQTLPLVVVAYVVRFLPEALAPVRASLTAVDPALEEAGRTLGRRRLSVAATVTLPLVRRGLVAGGALVFLTAMKELPATLLLRPAGTDTLAIRVWTGASEGFYAQAAPAGLVLIAVSALALLPMWPHDEVVR
jgi:iron(III) transport system permease protein